MFSVISCRSLSSTGDWVFGSGGNDYVTNRAAVAQDVGMRLRMFLGDCFFATDSGLDWFNLLGANGPKAQLAVNLAVNAAILGTPGVTGLLQTSLTISNDRKISLQYSVNTVFGATSGSFSFDVNTLV